MLDNVTQVYCPRCKRKLAEKKGHCLEVINGHQSMRVYQAMAIVIKCGRCGQITDVLELVEKSIQKSL